MGSLAGTLRPSIFYKLCGQRGHRGVLHEAEAVQSCQTTLKGLAVTEGGKEE